MKTIIEITEQYRQTSEFHKLIDAEFVRLVDDNPLLKSYRDFIERHCFGFGERSFIWMWKLILDYFGDKPIKFMEIGVFRGQILCLVRMLAHHITRIGISPLDSSDGHWESDYYSDIMQLHSEFNVPKDFFILHGLSTDKNIMINAHGVANELDCLYIDGGHTKEVVQSDIINYLPLVKKGGLIVIDDCANNLNGIYPGRFWGIQDVSDVVDKYLPMDEDDNYKHLFNLIHNRVWIKK
jgi:cephalosporin hydroxylase